MTFYHYSKLKWVKPLILLGSFFYWSVTNAQNQLPGNAIQLISGYSHHGSGDMHGIVFGTEYSKYVSKKFLINYNLRATINSGKETIIVNNNISGTRTDASVRFTTAGAQLGVNAGYSFFRTTQHEFIVSLGPFGRYQSASNGSDGYSIYSPQSTGQPTVLIGYDNKTPQETFSLGGIFQFQYSFTFKSKMYIGLSPAFQTDTNGDAIAQMAVIVGRRL